MGFFWPWLNLGNVFSESIYFIQWYEYTGVFGGTLWILVVNLFVFNFLNTELKVLNRKIIISKVLMFIFLVGTPILLSLFIYDSNTEKNNKIEIAILQPNIDPYNKKFKSNNSELFELIKNQSIDYISQDTKYLILPEGYFDEGIGINLKTYEDSKLKFSIDRFLNEYKNLKLIVGAQSFNIYPISENSPTITANKISNGRWVDITTLLFNLAIIMSHNFITNPN